MLKHATQTAVADSGVAGQMSANAWNSEHWIDASTSTPGAGLLTPFAFDAAKRLLLAIVTPDAEKIVQQPHFGFMRQRFAQSLTQLTGFHLFGFNNPTVTGTATAISGPAITNTFTQQTRAETLVTVASTTAVAGYRAAAGHVFPGGSGAGLGGFYGSLWWGPATGVATSTNRGFAGWGSSTAAPTDVEPSTITNMVGMGWDAADTNIQLMYRGAGAVTKVDLGASFPVPSADRTSHYRLHLYSPPGATLKVGYLVENMATGATARGLITTGLFAAGTLLNWRAWNSVGGTSSVVGTALMQVYEESY